MSSTQLIIDQLQATIANRPILRGVSLQLPAGELHALMGPNGSGKSTLSHVLMGHPGYTVTGGDIRLDGKSLLGMPPNERSIAGLFLAFQYPQAVPGVSVANFLRLAYNARRERAAQLGVRDFVKLLKEKMSRLKLDETFLERSVNDGFSGGEKKKLEILQLAVLEPRFAILDETDSGLDVDALRTVADGMNALRNSQTGFLLITHYQRILDYVKPDRVHILVDGTIVDSGGPELAGQIEKTGYEQNITTAKAHV